MKKQLIGIFIIMLFILTAALPVTAIKTTIENKDVNSYKWTIFIFIRGKVEDIIEETINDTEFYNCTAVDVKYFWMFYAFPNPFWLEFERRRVWNSDEFLIAKETFHGIINEGIILGIIYNTGET